MVFLAGLMITFEGMPQTILADVLIMLLFIASPILFALLYHYVALYKNNRDSKTYEILLMVCLLFPLLIIPCSFIHYIPLLNTILASSIITSTIYIEYNLFSNKRKNLLLYIVPYMLVEYCVIFMLLLLNGSVQQD